MTHKEIEYALSLNFDYRKKWNQAPLHQRADFASFVDKDLPEAKVDWKYLRRKRMFQIKWLRLKVGLKKHWNDMDSGDKRKAKKVIKLDDGIDVSAHWENHYRDKFTPSNVLTLF